MYTRVSAAKHMHWFKIARGVTSVGLLLSSACSSTSPPSAGAGSGGNRATAGSAAQAGAAGSSPAPSGGAGSGSAGALGVSGEPMTGGMGGAGSEPMPVACSPVPAGIVTFSEPSGTFDDAITITLSGGEPGDELRYTTDHSAPTATSPLYAAPLTFDVSTDLRVQVFTQGVPIGPPSGAVYVKRGGDTPHDLPVLVLDSFGRVPSSDVNERDYIDVALLGFDPGDGTTSLGSAPTLATQAAFHVRGQSSSRYEKKPYRLELREPHAEDRDCPLFGLPSESDWVLHSPFADKSLIRNAFAYSLGKDMGLTAPRFTWVELYLNSDGQALDAQDYQGVYLLVETIKNHKSRLNLQQLGPSDTALPDVAGGYIFKFEWRVMDLEQPLPCPSGQSNCWDYIEVVDPKPWVPEQQQYLTQHLQQVTDALHFTPASDATQGYPAFLDVRSFVDTVVINELTRNLDAYVRSQFMHKDRDGKLVAGPLWDFDLTSGVGVSGSTPNLPTSGFHYEAVKSRIDVTADWFPRLIADPAFDAQLRARYQELRQGLLSDAQLATRISSLSAGLAGGAERNFAKWNNLTTERIGNFTAPTADTWEGQLTAMRTWLVARLAWLDSQWL